MSETCGHNCHLLRTGLQCSPCRFKETQNTKKMNTEYTVIKELQIKSQNLSATVEKLESDYNSLLQNYAKVLKENTELKQVKERVLTTLKEQKFSSNRQFSTTIQYVIDKVECLTQ